MRVTITIPDKNPIAAFMFNLKTKYKSMKTGYIFIVVAMAIMMPDKNGFLIEKYKARLSRKKTGK